MAEDIKDPLQRFHIPDGTAEIRALGETGIKGRFDNIFHPEEVISDEFMGGKGRSMTGRGPDLGSGVQGGGSGADDYFESNPDYVDPELIELHNEYLEEIIANRHFQVHQEPVSFSDWLGDKYAESGAVKKELKPPLRHFSIESAVPDVDLFTELWGDKDTELIYVKGGLKDNITGDRIELRLRKENELKIVTIPVIKFNELLRENSAWENGNVPYIGRPDTPQDLLELHSLLSTLVLRSKDKKQVVLGPEGVSLAKEKPIKAELNTHGEVQKVWNLIDDSAGGHEESASLRNVIQEEKIATTVSEIEQIYPEQRNSAAEAGKNNPEAVMAPESQMKGSETYGAPVSTEAEKQRLQKLVFDPEDQDLEKRLGELWGKEGLKVSYKVDQDSQEKDFLIFYSLKYDNGAMVVDDDTKVKILVEKFNDILTKNHSGKLIKRPDNDEDIGNIRDLLKKISITNKIFTSDEIFVLHPKSERTQEPERKMSRQTGKELILSEEEFASLSPENNGLGTLEKLWMDPNAIILFKVNTENQDNDLIRIISPIREGNDDKGQRERFVIPVAALNELFNQQSIDIRITRPATDYEWNELAAKLKNLTLNGKALATEKIGFTGNLKKDLYELIDREKISFDPDQLAQIWNSPQLEARFLEKADQKDNTIAFFIKDESGKRVLQRVDVKVDELNNLLTEIGSHQQITIPNNPEDLSEMEKTLQLLSFKGNFPKFRDISYSKYEKRNQTEIEPAGENSSESESEKPIPPIRLRSSLERSKEKIDEQYWQSYLSFIKAWKKGIIPQLRIEFDNGSIKGINARVEEP